MVWSFQFNSVSLILNFGKVFSHGPAIGQKRLGWILNWILNR